MNNRPWLTQYPSGIPANIDTSEYETIVDFLADCFKKYDKKPAFECMGKALSYREVDKLSTDFGAYLQSRGLKKGDKIAIMLPNLLQYPICLFGAFKAGLTVVNTNPLYTSREMLHQFKDSEVRAIIIAENFAHNLEKILGETQIDTILTTSIGEMLGAIKGTIVNFAVRSIKRMVPKFNLPNMVSVKEAIKQGAKFEITSIANSGDDVVVHQYTGGTTGVAKGAMLTNTNLIANMLQIKAWMGGTLKEGEEVTLCPLPMYHIFAFTVNCMAMLGFGAHNVLITNARDLGSVIKAMKGNRITLMTGVNTLFNALLNHKDFAALELSNLRVTVAGGMALQKAVALKWEEVTGCSLAEGYGMTEASPVITINPLDGSHRISTIGLPVSSTDVRIVDDHGNPIGTGEVGELQCKGPQIMKGYYKKPEATIETIKDGWLCTGDMAKMDEDGFFKIVDRKKDMILVSGFNVYPNEIEDVVATHPKVMEVAAIGIPNEKSGECVKIFVVKKDKSLKEDELIQFCRENLTGYKVPKEIEFRKDLPKSNVGKILRKELR